MGGLKVRRADCGEGQLFREDSVEEVVGADFVVVGADLVEVVGADLLVVVGADLVEVVGADLVEVV